MIQGFELIEWLLIMKKVKFKISAHSLAIASYVIKVLTMG